MEKYLIYGYGKSGHSVEAILSDIGANYEIYDDNIKVHGGVFVRYMTHKKILSYTTIILSPGVSIFSRLIRYARKKNIEVISEIEFASRYIHQPIIAVTGTDGKTTTVRLIHDILTLAGYNAPCVGNIGTPLCDMYKKNCDYLAVETSSFQLEAIKDFHPHISVLLNISSDHLDRHKTQQNYINVKHNIFINQDDSDIAIYNADDANITPPIIDQVISFGKNGMCKIIDNNIYYNNSSVSGTYQIPPTYFEDLMAAVCVAKALKIDNDVISKAISMFQISKHRLQVVKNRNNIMFVDDSKSTSIHSTLGALKSFPDQKIILILGGQNKNLNFGDLFANLPPNVEYVVTYGKSSNYIYRKSRKYKDHITSHKCHSLDEAVAYTCTIATVGMVVLFSPACASFDSYHSYAERGEHFVSLVKKYDEK